MSVAYTIYKLKEEIEAFETIIELVGEDQEVKEQYEALKIELKSNIDKAPKIINHYKDIISNLEIEEARIKEYKATINDKIDSFKSMLLSLVKDNEGKNIKGDLHTISMTKRKTKMYDETEIPKEYFVEKVSIALDKKAIIADMKEGVEVDGVTEVVKEGLLIR